MVAKKKRPVTYIIQGERLHETCWRYWTPREDRFNPSNFFYYCPVCGDIWARELNFLATTWNARAVPCRHHDNKTGLIPGTLLNRDLKERLPGASKTILMREFKLLDTYYECYRQHA